MMPRASRRTGPDPAEDIGRDAAPLPFERVDEMVRSFYRRHPTTWVAAPMTGRDSDKLYSPTRMPAMP